MQVDTELIGVLSGIISSVIGTSVGYGIMKHKVDRLEKDMLAAERKYVSNELFSATIQPLKEDLHEMKQDLKEVLKTIQTR